MARYNDQIVNTCTRNQYCTVLTCVRYGFSVDDTLFNFIYYPCEEVPGVWVRIATIQDGFLQVGKNVVTMLGVIEVDVGASNVNFSSSFQSGVHTGVSLR